MNIVMKCSVRFVVMYNNVRRSMTYSEPMNYIRKSMRKD
jgi:hypothetical protein